MANRGVNKGARDTPFSDSAEAVKKGSITDGDMQRLIEGTGTGQARVPALATHRGLQPCASEAAASHVGTASLVTRLQPLSSPEVFESA